MNLTALFAPPRTNPIASQWDEIVGILDELHIVVPGRYDRVMELREHVTKRFEPSEVAAVRMAPADWARRPVEALMAPPLSMPMDEAAGTVARSLDRTLPMHWQVSKDSIWMASVVTWLDHKAGVRLATEAAGRVLNRIPEDDRPRGAVYTVDQWLEGETTRGDLRVAREFALRAMLDADDADQAACEVALGAVRSALYPVDVNAYRAENENAVQEVRITIDDMEAMFPESFNAAAWIRRLVPEPPSVEAWVRAQL